MRGTGSSGSRIYCARLRGTSCSQSSGVGRRHGALIGLLNFNTAAGTTASIILLTARDTNTLSIHILELLLLGYYEQAAVVQIILGGITIATLIGARHFGMKLGVRHS